MDEWIKVVEASTKYILDWNSGEVAKFNVVATNAFVGLDIALMIVDE